MNPIVSAESLKTIERASGYQALGMFDDALEELDSLSSPDRECPPAVLIRAEIFNAQKQFAQAVEWLRAHEANCSGHSAWFILAAYATRRAKNIGEAREILRKGVVCFPKEWLMLYNLACYETQLGNTGHALLLLEKAVKLHANCRALAAQDPDFAPLKNDPLFLGLLDGSIG
ncbi:hypothetical protein QQ054_34360 [Oscillatoria amoena NRMC-F 0135]|nr:hypothetical protein [Oscillatoria laete-virens]MDL5051086.1 hypothetical protein [Oscillatoria amoena NRMC-F 0135]MDL5054533.1 hypothetical protein [Oscillatoria laete-virens NRMC-F 0139]